MNFSSPASTDAKIIQSIALKIQVILYNTSPHHNSFIPLALCHKFLYSFLCHELLGLTFALALQQ